MKIYARIVDGVVQEVINLPDDLKIEETFHPDIVKQCIPCPATVDQGWTYAKGKFTAPEPWNPSKKAGG